MKRQRNVDAENTKATNRAAMAKKMKAKRAVEKVQDKNIGGEWTQGFVENCINWEELPWLGGVVDEQMSWGSIWLPFWDVQYMGEACTEMFSDVVWDYDLWNLRSIN
ncbi:uncharacterized protein LOC110618076 [Manihot esculenta]|uniref:Uncharacterized protein n=1 Tax=Manihot esculenta TaxID=3983 RepID=A0A2C9VQP3_MANES|nr:uncharacterized protein LOC110618076 [Manihot esculenta]OAY47294.1 hypothetical protein MANES_06G067700v8 [Manihot esculenta]